MSRSLQFPLILSVLLILWSPFTAASQVEFSSTDGFLKATLKGEDKLSIEAKGDLNGDGLEDWVGVIERKKPDPPATNQLYVLLRSGQSGYRVAEKSKEAEIAGAGCCWVENLEIKNSSIYIQNNAKSANGMEVAIHQFKLYQGKWRLIGLTIHNFAPETDDSTETDMNLLTGAVIEKKQKGEGKPTTSRRHKRFPISFLKDFDFYNGFGME